MICFRTPGSGCRSSAIAESAGTGTVTAEAPDVRSDQGVLASSAGFAGAIGPGGGFGGGRRGPLRRVTPREAARAIFGAALAAGAAGPLIGRALRVDGPKLVAGPRAVDLGRLRRLLVLGCGKAGGAMARAVEGVLGDRIADGFVVVKDGHTAPTRRIRLAQAGHPVPDGRGQAAAARLLELAGAAGAGDLVIFLISGGGSALTPAPAPPVTLEEKQAVTTLLLAAGATINELNAVRKHLSLFKGGQLARAAAPAMVLTLILSDVIGDPLDVIASGPTAPAPTTFADALAVLTRRAVRERVPASVLARLEAGARGEVEETPKPGDPVFERVTNLVIGNNALTVDAGASLEPRQHRSRDPFAHGAPGQHGEGVGEGRGVGSRRSRRDHVERVADDVGEDEREHHGWRRRPRQPAPLEERQMLADRVQLVDGRPGGEQKRGDRLLLFQGHRGRRRRSERRAPTRDQKYDEVAGTGRTGQLEEPRRGGLAATVGYRMARLRQPDPSGGRGVSVLDDDESVGDAVAQHALDRPRHRPTRFAAAQHEQAPETAEVDGSRPGDELGAVHAQRATDEGPGGAGGQRGPEDGARRLAGGHTSEGASTAPSEPSPRTDCAGEAGARSKNALIRSNIRSLGCDGSGPGALSDCGASAAVPPLPEADHRSSGNRRTGS